MLRMVAHCAWSGRPLKSFVSHETPRGILKLKDVSHVSRCPRAPNHYRCYCCLLGRNHAEAVVLLRAAIVALDGVIADVPTGGKEQRWEGGVRVNCEGQSLCREGCCL